MHASPLRDVIEQRGLAPLAEMARVLTQPESRVRRAVVHLGITPLSVNRFNLLSVADLHRLEAYFADKPTHPDLTHEIESLEAQL